MWYFISFLCPSIFSVMIEEHFLKTKDWKHFILNIGFYVMIINLIVTSIFCLLFKIDYNIGQCIEFYPGVAVKYTLGALIVACVLAFLKVVFIKNFEVSVETKRKKNC